LQCSWRISTQSVSSCYSVRDVSPRSLFLPVAVFVTNLHAACFRCLCHAANECSTSRACSKGYCGPFSISHIYWADAGRQVLPYDDPERKEGTYDNVLVAEDTQTGKEVDDISFPVRYSCYAPLHTTPCFLHMSMSPMPRVEFRFSDWPARCCSESASRASRRQIAVFYNRPSCITYSPLTTHENNIQTWTKCTRNFIYGSVRQDSYSAAFSEETRVHLIQWR
jgi:hypothetical protein